MQRCTTPDNHQLTPQHLLPQLLHTGRFKEAFLLDCDVILRRDPAFMFDAPLFRERGNYFWGDIYGTGMVKDEVFPYVGELLMLSDGFEICMQAVAVIPCVRQHLPGGQKTANTDAGWAATACCSDWLGRCPCCEWFEGLCCGNNTHPPRATPHNTPATCHPATLCSLALSGWPPCCSTAGLNMTVRDALNEGKSDFNRYAESGQVMINRAMHLGEWPY